MVATETLGCSLMIFGKIHKFCPLKLDYSFSWEKIEARELSASKAWLRQICQEECRQEECRQ